MSKNILFLGGAALLLVTFLALVECNSGINPVSFNPVLEVEKIVLERDTLTVTFKFTLANIDNIMNETNYTLNKANYIITKNNTGRLRNVGSITNGKDDKTVSIAVPEVHRGLREYDTLNVELKGGKRGTYTVRPPEARIGTDNGAAKLTVHFDRELYTAEGKVTANDDVTAFFKISAAFGDSYPFSLKSAKAGGADTVTFEFTNMRDNDILEPASPAVTSFEGLAWEGKLSYDAARNRWKVETP
jgi:hypothetical protein